MFHISFPVCRGGALPHIRQPVLLTEVESRRLQLHPDQTGTVTRQYEPSPPRCDQRVVNAPLSCSPPGPEQRGGAGLPLRRADDLLDGRHHAGQHDPPHEDEREQRGGQ